MAAGMDLIAAAPTGAPGAPTATPAAGAFGSFLSYWAAGLAAGDPLALSSGLPGVEVSTRATSITSTRTTDPRDIAVDDAGDLLAALRIGQDLLPAVADEPSSAHAEAPVAGGTDVSPPPPGLTAFAPAVPAAAMSPAAALPWSSAMESASVSASEAASVPAHPSVSTSISGAAALPVSSNAPAPGLVASAETSPPAAGGAAPALDPVSRPLLPRSERSGPAAPITSAAVAASTAPAAPAAAAASGVRLVGLVSGPNRAVTVSPMSSGDTTAPAATATGHASESRAPTPSLALTVEAQRSTLSTDDRGVPQPAAADAVSTLTATTSPVGGLPAQSAATAVSLALPPAAALTDRPSLPMEAPASVLAEQVVEMIEQDTWSARLRLDPPALGEVEIKLAVREGQVSMSLSSSDAQARLLLAQSLPELSQQLASRGLQLMGADVGDPSSGRDRAPEKRLSRRASDDPSVEAMTDGDKRRRTTGLMDGFA